MHKSKLPVETKSIETKQTNKKSIETKSIETQWKQNNKLPITTCTYID
jgi:hypothetical protein